MSDSSNKRERDTSDSGGEWTIAGEQRDRGKQRKDKKRHQEEAEERRKKQPKVDRNKGGGTAAERHFIRRKRDKEGHVNVIKTRDGTSQRVPAFKPPSLNRSGAIRTDRERTIEEKQEQFKATYAAITYCNEADQTYEVKVSRKDKTPMTRMNQWEVQFKVSEAILRATKEGKSGEDIAHKGTRLSHMNLAIYCTPKAGPFYKKAVNELVEYEAFLPGEKPPGRLIHTLLPGPAESILPKINEHFAAGTFGEVRQNQVKISRKAWKPDNLKTGSWNVYLEINEEAFEWLRSKNWMSPIGLFMVRWGKVPVRGIKGYIAPDTDISALRDELKDQQPGPSRIGHDTTIVAQEPEQQDERHRHITGEEHALINSLEENELFTESLTVEQENELLNIVASAPPTTPTTPKTSTPYKETLPARQHKLKKQIRKDGTIQADVSDASSTEGDTA